MHSIYFAKIQKVESKTKEYYLFFPVLLLFYDFVSPLQSSQGVPLCIGDCH